MQSNKIIRSIAAGFLLFLFAFSITPKNFLHDALATHKDSVSFCKNKDGHCFHQENYNCHFDNLVVTTDYVVELSAASSDCTILLKTCYCLPASSPYTAPVSGHENKGPPSLI